MAKIKKSLRETHPEVADIWVYELNGELTPDDVSIHSDDEVYFQCKSNPKHIFKKHIRKMVSNRDGHITGCIYCGPNAKMAFPGETDLLSVIKEAEGMWDFEKNALDPTTVLPNSNKHAYFKCEMGHSTYRKIEDFSHSPCCPECQKQDNLLVNNVLQTEDFWDFKKNRDLNLDKLIQSATDMAWFKCPKCGYEWIASIKLWRKHSYCECCGFDGKDYRTIDKKIVTLKMKVPESVEIWDYDKNGTQTPDSLTWISNFNAHFKCKLGHVFQRPVSEMIRNGEFRHCIECNPKYKNVSRKNENLFDKCMEAKKMWDYELNKSLSPQTLTTKSKENAHFICTQGHRFESKIDLFVKNPICKRCDLIENRSIASRRPDMFKYWDFEKNDIDTYLTLPYDKRDAHWICERCNYSWVQKISNRASAKKGLCPSCDLKREYDKSQNKAISFQQYNPEAAKLWIGELNNGIFPDRIAPKSGKTITMRCKKNPKHIYPIKVCNISNEEPYGCPYCRKNSIIFPGETDLFSISEKAMNMWSCEENTGYDLQSISPKSSDKVMWICENGHHFRRSISYFMINQTCPKCKKGKNAIVRFPHLMNQWDFANNRDIDVNTTSSDSRDYAHWKCKKCGYEWEAQISSRKASKGLCPCCEVRIVINKGTTDLFSLVPELKKWYDTEKNKDIDIASLSISTKDDIWWKCPVCSYSWAKSPSSRVYVNDGVYSFRKCPVCAGIIRVISYAEEYPELASRFVKELNGCSLNDVPASSSKENYWWHCDICNKNFERTVEGMIRSRNTAYKGCSYCTGKKVSRENSFAFRHPEVMDEFDLSNKIDPYTVVEHSDKHAKWICRNNPVHKWEASFEARALGQGACNVCRGYRYGKMFFEEHGELEKYYDTNENQRPFKSYSNMSNDYVLWKCDKGHMFRRTIYNMGRMDCFRCPVCENYLLQIGENDLASQYPDLAKDFNVKKNKSTPQEIIISSTNPDTWWTCAVGHEFQRAVSSRIKRSAECPVCNRTIVIKNVNDFQHAYPAIEDVWDYEQNERTPDRISDRCNDKFHFKCSKGHRYVAVLSTLKSNDFKCLVCSNKIIQIGVNSLVDTDFLLSQEFSPNEERKPIEFAKTSAYSPLWKCTVCNNDYHWPIKDKELGDTSCPFCNNRYTKLGVNSLLDTDEELAREYAADNEYDLTRINKDSKTWVYWICPDCHGRYGAYINERELGDDNCPFCKNERALEDFNSLVDTHELLIKEWSANNKRKPTEFLKKNIYIALWNCPTCHGEYPARICDREIGDDSCPYCNDRKVLVGLNSLVDTHEMLVKEWSFENERKASEFLKSNTYSALWNCPTCHGKYMARICDREIGDDSCPYCNNKKVLPGVNSFKVKHIDLIDEWDHINNYLLCDPDEILDTYSKDVWWDCKKCKTKYLMSPKKKVYYQYRHMKPCPYCKGLRRKKKYFF